MMKPQFQKLYLLFAVLFFSLHCRGDTIVNQRDFEVNVEMIYETKIMLRVSLTNNSSKTLEFDNSVIDRREFAILIAKQKGYDGALEEFTSIRDLPIGTFKLKPGESYINIIDMENSFPAIKEALNSSGLILFWSIEVKPIDAVKGERFGGFKLL